VEGPGFGENLTGPERAVQWINTGTLTLGLLTGLMRPVGEVPPVITASDVAPAGLAASRTASAAELGIVRIAEGAGYESKSADVTVYTGAYDPVRNVVYLGDTGHANGMAAAGGTPISGQTPGITVVKTPSGVTWAADSPSLSSVAMTPEQAANIQAALQKQFPGVPINQVPTIK